MPTGLDPSTLPLLHPLATAWAEQQAELIARSGTPLDADECRIALQVGVAQPEQVRIVEVDQIPFPDHPILQAAARDVELLGPNTGGITFGHSIYVRHDCRSRRLVSHELRHVHQYEQAGSIAAFLSRYLEQLATHGYEMAPLECDARQHELP